MNATLAGIVIGLVMSIAAALQFVTSRSKSLRDRPSVRAGKRIMAAGFLIAALRFFWLGFTATASMGVSIGILSYVLVAIGAILMSIERLTKD